MIKIRLVGSTFSIILDLYIRHVNGYGKEVDLIFDGYMNSNTKDCHHPCHNPIQSMDIDFILEMKLDRWKELFLSNNQ